MNHITITTRSAQETKKIASKLAAHLRASDVILLKGGLGAGKTQFAQGLAAGLGVAQAITSPTFNILLEYHSGALPLYHFDLYRLNSEDELEDIAFYEVVEGGGVSVIEWWDKFPACMPDERLEIEISAPNEDANTRTITLTACAQSYEQILDLLSAEAL